MNGKKRVRIFAGPNGFGKSTLKNDIIAPRFKIGTYINADEMLKTMQTTSRLEFSDYKLMVDEAIFEQEYSKWTIPTNRNWWVFENNGISVKDKNLIDGYFVSFLADLIRNALLGITDRFSFETVMSHPSKLDFIKKAREYGYKVYLYFISLHDPDLNVKRVSTRFESGGHNVDENKVRMRYKRTMDLLFDAIKLADSVYLFDNSSSKPQLFAKKENEQLETYGEFIPVWYQQYVLAKIKSIQ